MLLVNSLLLLYISPKSLHLKWLNEWFIINVAGLFLVGSEMFIFMYVVFSVDARFVGEKAHQNVYVLVLGLLNVS